MKGRLILPLLAAMLACGTPACSTTGGLKAHHGNETAWVYFPMYAHDTAHAVHLDALHFRRDGLLESATRYPRISSEQWSEEASAKGVYAYQQRLIDCETGLFIDTRLSLLANDGSVLESRDATTQEQAEQLLQRAHRTEWPNKSETFLACVAASDEALHERREQQARARQPLVSYAPLTAGLVAESKAILGRTTPDLGLDESDIRAFDNAGEVFTALRTRYLDWRRSIAGPGMDRQRDYGRRDRERAELQLTELAMRTLGFPDGLKLLGDGLVEYRLPSHEFIEDVFDSPPGGGDWYDYTGRLYERVRLDCLSGLIAPLAFELRSDDGIVEAAVPVSAEAVAKRLRLDYGSPAVAWSLRRQAVPQDTARVCREVDAVLGQDAPAPSAVDVVTLAAMPSPAARLLAVRAVLRSQAP